MLNHRLTDTKSTKFLKLVSTAIFAWSGFFWAGVTILNFYINMPNSSHLAQNFLIGTVLLLASLILCWFRFYILQLPICAVGTVFFLIASAEMIDTARFSGLEFKPSFELRYLPIIGMSVISLILAMIQIWDLISKKIEDNNKFNNSPSKSILED